MPDTPRWFDAHLDLAYLTETGRDMHAEPEDARGRHQPASITLPSLRSGGVAGCLGTLFTQMVPDPTADDAETGAFAYDPGAPATAWVAAKRQLKLYDAWVAGGAIRRLGRRGTDDPADTVGKPLVLGVLMEGADPIETPEQADEWAGEGVVAVGLCWRQGSRYAGGDAPDAHCRGGLSDQGRELVGRLDDLGIVHDLSHLSQHATDDVLGVTEAPVMASHSNCRALLDGTTERHLSDEVIVEIGRRGGVIGLNLLSFFLAPAGEQPRGQRASIDQALAHVERICELQGHRRGVMLGSDADGGIDASVLPQGIDRPAHYERLAEGLMARGWSDAEIEGFRFENFRRFWRA